MRFYILNNKLSENDVNDDRNSRRHKEMEMQFLSRSQQDFLVDIYKIVLKFVWDDKEARIAKIILKKKEKVGGINLSNFKIYY